MKSAGIVPVYIEREPLFLLLRAYRYWDFPKGVMESGESSLAAARRELREETGIAQVEFKWGKDYFETPPYAKGKVARYYLAQVFTQVVELTAEHAQYLWLPYAHARRRLVPRVQAVLDWAMANFS